MTARRDLDDTAADTADDDDRREVGVGSMLGQYRVEEEIGRGGMGVVFRAVHVGIGQLAAVKVLLVRRAADPSYLRRFTNEARAVSRVDHPGLVKLFDFGETASGVPYILMEHLVGELLRARLDRLRRSKKCLDLVSATRLARQAASALTTTHARGIVHRDLKPENLMLVADDEAPGGERVKILDFGIARLTHERTTETTPGTVIGTAMYMSPEQCAGEAEIDGRSDVYSLGVVLYEMLRGAPPFLGDFATLLRRHLFEKPFPLEITAPEPAAGIGRLVARMLAKEPSRRPDMAEVLEELRRCEGGASREPEAERGAITSPHAVTEDRSPPLHEATTRSSSPPLDAATTVAEPTIAPPVAALIEPPIEPPATRAPASRPRRAWPIALAVVAAITLLFAVRALRSKPPVVALTDMVQLPGGTFQMGSTAVEIDAECRRLGADCPRELLDREQPVREVTVSAFQLDAHEVDNAAFAAWLEVIVTSLDVREDRDTHAARFVDQRAGAVLIVDLCPGLNGIIRTPDGHFAVQPGQERKPASLVTWDGASLYCHAKGKRLPTEAEWELAARGTTRRRFPWGNEAPRCDGVAFDRARGGSCEGRPAGAADVGTSPQDRTPEGVWDLGGNASEWLEDAFTLPYYPPCGACVDPRVEASTGPGADLRIRRGGAWSMPDLMSRGATRARWKRSDVLDGLGFRCATR
ncbi:MAG: SUMF1/EgtB/PvdO family nonheme iron enzyme [Byssovorax sp.]